MIYGYCRVSTRGQLEGNGIQAQEKEILSKYENAVIYTEQYTGSKVLERPVLKEVIDKLQQGDLLVVWKLDRLARNTKEGIDIIEQLFAKGVAVHVLNVGLLEDTTMGRFFLQTLLAVAEMERNLIIERTQAGKEIAKTKDGFKDGRPKKYAQGVYKMAVQMKLDGKTYKEIEKETGLSKATIVRTIQKYKLEQIEKESID